MTRNKIILFISDVLMLCCSFYLSLLLRFDAVIPKHFLSHLPFTLLCMSLIYLTSFYFAGLYRSLWKYASIRELMQIAVSIFIGCTLFYITGHLLLMQLPASIYFIDALLITLSVSGLRISYRVIRKLKYHFLAIIASKYSPSSTTIMIVGAGETAKVLINEYKKHPKLGQVLLLIDDDPQKRRTQLQGIPVKGTREDIPRLARHYNISQIILALPHVSKSCLSEILTYCHQTSCQILIFPGISNALSYEKSVNRLRPVQIEDLLGRDEILLDNTNVLSYIENSCVLVTGGGGSIGSELCRQISKFHPSHLVIFDIYENNAYDLQNELLREDFPSEKLSVVIGSVRDEKRLEEIFSCYKPDIVFHAAAHKHVPLMEESPKEAIKNNVFGTYHVAKCASRHHVKKFILISTDKAVNPTNVMGASKRLCEMIIQSFSSHETDTEFAAVRFGNVLGSNGSVIPLFKKQIAAGGPVTITHPDIIRYFMTIPEAVRLILQAMSFATGGEIFVLDMGKPVKILDLATNLIHLSGYEVGKDIEIKFTGLRPGEKLYEELLMGQKDLRSTTCDKIFVEKPMPSDYEKMCLTLAQLQSALEQDEDIRRVLMQLVPTYHPYTSSFKTPIQTSYAI